ncbi:hypothetical protein VTO42DRAFT_2654 [Malbranchea cinnamomea]
MGPPEREGILTLASCGNQDFRASVASACGVLLSAHAMVAWQRGRTHRQGSPLAEQRCPRSRCPAHHQVTGSPWG